MSFPFWRRPQRPMNGTWPIAGRARTAPILWKYSSGLRGRRYPQGWEPWRQDGDLSSSLRPSNLKVSCGSTIQPKPSCVNILERPIAVVAVGSRPRKGEGAFRGTPSKTTKVRRTLEAIIVSGHSLYGGVGGLRSRSLGAGRYDGFDPGFFI